MFDVYVYHHHSLLYSGCTLVLQYNLITQHIHTVYMHMYKGDLWNAANICGLAIYIYIVTGMQKCLQSITFPQYFGLECCTCIISHTKRTITIIIIIIIIIHTYNYTIAAPICIHNFVHNFVTVEQYI